MSDDTAAKMKADQDAGVDAISPGFVFAAKKIKRYYEVLTALELPEPIIIAAITAYCREDSRFECELHLRNIAIQQHQAFAAEQRQAQEAASDANH